MVESLGEAQAHAVVGLEELVGEVLREEGKHEVGALGVRPERSPLQQPLNQQLRVRQFCLAWRGKKKKERGAWQCATHRYTPLDIIRPRVSLKTVPDRVHTAQAPLKHPRSTTNGHVSFGLRKNTHNVHDAAFNY